ncbi:MAG: GAF domain-containing protein [Anaerolineales bacterium]|nr:GAF domain-containing protein [Anaerolineales bacterium]
MGTLVSVGFSIVLLIGMYTFGLYALRNLRWVLISLIWGAVGYGLSYLLVQRAVGAKLNLAVMLILVIPIIQQILASLGVLAIVHWEKFDNLVDGAVYGFASGLGYAAAKAFEYPIHNVQELQTRGLDVLSSTLVLATASGIVGVVVTQFYFKHRARRTITLLSGLGAGIGYTVIYNFLAIQKIGGYVVPLAFGVGGVTLIGLYITGQLRDVLIRVGIEKRRADNLLEIVIPIGIKLTYEKNFQQLLEDMLLEAKSFCRADGGALYLRKDNTLEFAVVRNDSLNIAMGGASGTEITLPPLNLYSEEGKPNNRSLPAYVALTGKTVNIEDAYVNRQFDFSSTRDFDEQHNYATISLLTIPLKSNTGEVQGVLQLSNALDGQKKQLVSFDGNLQQLMESFSALAAAALEGYIQEQNLRAEIRQLRIEIDHVKREKQVAEITETTYFRELKEKAQQMRENKKENDD